MPHDFDEDFETNPIIDRVSNGENSAYFVDREDGTFCSDGTRICDTDDEEKQDKIDEYKEEWKETNWSTSDYADYYGCDESEVEDAMNDDMKDY